MGSNPREHFESNDTIYEFNNDDRDTDYDNSTSPKSIARDIFTMSGSRPKSDSESPKISTTVSMIPKELYELVPEEVMRQQHAYYLEKYGRGGGNPHPATCLQVSNY